MYEIPIPNQSMSSKNIAPISKPLKGPPHEKHKAFKRTLSQVKTDHKPESTLNCRDFFFRPEKPMKDYSVEQFFKKSYSLAVHREDQGGSWKVSKLARKEFDDLFSRLNDSANLINLKPDPVIQMIKEKEVSSGLKDLISKFKDESSGGIEKFSHEFLRVPLSNILAVLKAELGKKHVKMLRDKLTS